MRYLIFILTLATSVLLPAHVRAADCTPVFTLDQGIVMTWARCTEGAVIETIGGGYHIRDDTDAPSVTYHYAYPKGADHLTIHIRETAPDGSSTVYGPFYQYVRFIPLL